MARTLDRLSAPDVSVDAPAEDYAAVALEASGLGTWTWNPSTGRTSVCDRLKMTLGYERGNNGWDGPWDDLFARVVPDELPLVLEEMQLHLDGIWPFDVECRLVTAHGDARWFRVTAVAERGADNRVTRLVGAMTDVSARRTMEARLQASEERFRRMFELMPLGLLVTRAGERVEANGAFDRIAGAAGVEALIGAVDERFAGDGHYAPVEVDLEGMAPVEVRGVALGDDQSLHVVEDIGPRREAARRARLVQRQLVHAGRMAGMSDVAAEVLHHLGNMLNSLVVSTSLMQQHTRRATSPMVQLCALIDDVDDVARWLAEDPRGRHLPGFLASYGDHLRGELDALRRENRRVDELLEHVRGVVRLQEEHVRRDCAVEPVTVDELFDEVLLMTRMVEQTGGVEVRIGGCVPGAVSVQRHKLVQVLVNLLVNAIEACGDEGVDAPCVVLESAVDGDGTLVLRVSDNGSGMTAATRARLFEAGFSTRAGHHGFGLHNAGVLAASMGGALVGDSDGPGRGARFTLTLPTVRARPGDQPQAAPPALASV